MLCYVIIYTATGIIDLQILNAIEMKMQKKMPRWKFAMGFQKCVERLLKGKRLTCYKV